MESASFSAHSSLLLHVGAFAAILLLTVALQRLWTRRSTSAQHLLPLPPGRLGLPFVGETFHFVECRKRDASRRFFEEREAMYGEIFKTHIMGDPTIIASNPEGHKMVFSKGSNFVDSSWPASFPSVLGKHSLGALRGHAAKRIKHALMTALRPEALQLYTGKADESAQSFIQEHWEGKSEVSVFPLMKRLTFRIACELLMSRYEKEEQEMLEEPFTTMEKGIFQLRINLPGTRYTKAIKAAEILRSRIQLWINERRCDLAVGKVSNNADMLSCLLSYVDKDGKALSDDDIKQNILLMLFAGHDTTSVATTMMCKFLALNPDIFDEVYKENKEILIGKGQNEPLSWADIQKMKLSWRVVQETLRLHPPVEGGFRMAVKDFEYSGFRIPKAWKLYWSTSSTHYNSKYFPEPSKFDPSRFEGAGLAPYAFVPFGGGPRMCPGNEFARMVALIVLHHLVIRFSWTLVDPHEAIIVDPTPYPTKGLPILLKSRTT